MHSCRGIDRETITIEESAVRTFVRAFLPQNRLDLSQLESRLPSLGKTNKETCMKARSNFPRWIRFVLVVFATATPMVSYAQCYLSQECAPQDEIIYTPNRTGQV